MVVVFAIIGAVLGFVPGGSFIMIPMEIFLVYSIQKKYDAFDFVTFILLAGALGACSIFLKGLASFLHVIPLIGQFANSIVGAGFILIVGNLAEQHYASKKA